MSIEPHDLACLATQGHRLQVALAAIDHAAMTEQDDPDLGHIEPIAAVEREALLALARTIYGAIPRPYLSRLDALDILIAALVGDALLATFGSLDILRPKHPDWRVWVHQLMQLGHLRARVLGGRTIHG